MLPAAAAHAALTLRARGRPAAAACAFPLVHLILFLEIDDNVVSPSGSDSRRVLRRAGRGVLQRVDRGGPRS